MSKDVWLTFDFAKDHWVLAVKPELNNTVGVSCLYGTNPEGMVFNEYYSHTADALHYVTAREVRDREKILSEQSKKQWSKSLNESFNPVVDSIRQTINRMKRILMTDKYKPFDLKRALSGDKFVRADGVVPSEWNYFKHLANDNEPLSVVIGGEIYWYNEYGINDRNKNLVMVPIKKKLWVAVAKNERMDFARALKYYYMNEAAFSNQFDLLQNIAARGFNTNDYHLIQVEIDE